MRTINKALFLDLDGTIIVTKSGRTFAKDKDDWQFNSNVLQRIEQFVDSGYYIMIVSNQGGIEIGHVSMNDFRLKIRKIVNEIIVATGVPFSRVGYRFSITNNPEDFYRKPNPGMAYDLAMAYILNLSECIMVGDASGRVRNTVNVFFDESSPTKWSHSNGTHLLEKEAKYVNAAHDNSTYGHLIMRDFSNSDFKFAMNAGMLYMDIEDWLGELQTYRKAVETY